jgi:hypothetical protein
VIKVLVATRVPGVDVHDVMQTHRRHVVQLMQEWTRIKRDAPAQDVNLALVVDAELYRLDSVVRWLDAAQSRLRRSAVDGEVPVPSDGPARTARTSPAASASKAPTGARR